MKKIGIEKNDETAVFWYQKAAAEGSACAQYELGHCYWKGIGVTLNIKAAQDCFRKAAMNGNKQAIKDLKKMQVETNSNSNFKQNNEKKHDCAEGAKNVKMKSGNNSHRKKEKIFKSLDSLQPVANIVNETATALKNPARSIKDSAISQVLAGVIGAGVGGAGSFAALYGLGTVGLSAAGITSGLAVAGSLVGAGMVAGIFVLAAPVAIATGASVAVAAKMRDKQLESEKERLYIEALKQHEALIRALKKEAHATKERLEYLQSLNILLQQAIKDLEQDLKAA